MYPFLLSNVDINLCAFQMYFMNLVSMLNIAYCLPMNQKYYSSPIMLKGLVLIIDSIHFRFLMEIIINACGIFKVQLRLVQTSNTIYTMGNIANNDKCIANVFQHCRMNQIKCILKHFLREFNYLAL